MTRSSTSDRSILAARPRDSTGKDVAGEGSSAGSLACCCCRLPKADDHEEDAEDAERARAGNAARAAARLEAARAVATTAAIFSAVLHFGSLVVFLLLCPRLSASSVASPSLPEVPLAPFHSADSAHFAEGDRPEVANPLDSRVVCVSWQRREGKS